MSVLYTSSSSARERSTSSSTGQKNIFDCLIELSFAIICAGRKIWLIDLVPINLDKNIRLISRHTYNCYTKPLRLRCDVVLRPKYLGFCKMYCSKIILELLRRAIYTYEDQSREISMSHRDVSKCGYREISLVLKFSSWLLFWVIHNYFFVYIWSNYSSSYYPRQSTLQKGAFQSTLSCRNKLITLPEYWLQA